MGGNISNIGHIGNFEEKVSTAMVNDSANITKRKITEHNKIPRHMTLEIQVLAWHSHKYEIICIYGPGDVSPLGAPGLNLRNSF